jgi:regulator of cell morphogenesis and NO signaling
VIAPTDTLGAIAASHPGATNVFLRHRLDFCCGGGRSLADACRTVNLDPHLVIGEILARDDAQDEKERWTGRPLGELIDHILTRYHERLRRDLPPLVEAARRVERVHATKTACPHGLTAHLERMAVEVESHMRKEEQVLFPALRAGHRGPALHMPIRVMMQEHDEHGENLRRLRELTTDLTAPAEACTTWRALYEGLTALEADLMRHIHLENNVLFPAALAAAT